MMKFKKKNLSNVALLGLILWLSINACVNHDIGEIEGSQPHPVSCLDVDEEISYDEAVKTIIQASCLKSDCHGDEPSIPDWGELSNLQDPEYKAEIKRRITLPDLDPDKMPRIGSLTEAQRKAIYCWIEQGAQDN